VSGKKDRTSDERAIRYKEGTAGEASTDLFVLRDEILSLLRGAPHGYFYDESLRTFAFPTHRVTFDCTQSSKEACLEKYEALDKVLTDYSKLFALERLGITRIKLTNEKLPLSLQKENDLYIPFAS